MVDRQAQAYDTTGFGHALNQGEAIDNPPNPQDGNLRRVEDWGEEIGTVHPEIAQREGAAGRLSRLQRAGSGGVRQALDLGRKLDQRELPGILDDRHDETIAQGDG